jgi:signal transduction histidine kinase
MNDPAVDQGEANDPTSAQQEIQMLKAQLSEAHEELEKTNSELMQLTLELDDRVSMRTEKLRMFNQKLVMEIKERKRVQTRLTDALEELKCSQISLLQAEKMSAIGILTAGIAHELNNPLMGILNYCQYVLKKLDHDRKLQQILKDAEKSDPELHPDRTQPADLFSYGDPRRTRLQNGKLRGDARSRLGVGIV